ncbi:porin [Pararobbsia silviterrae]|uniref:Porin n=1 Tax=Pararobbsia silviterrae TaxID=1792498 RepID=A0A494XSH4_9BURK|nr:porin [Pararobbsia silviterrae]RKP53557.1 porin [Pararobbsia silviterrae]
MKRISITAMLALSASLAHAQSSVSLYGLVDGGIRWVNGTKGGPTIEYSGALTPDRFGLQGSEDLGDGTKVIFRLESQFESSGALQTSNVLFGRDAYVGLDGPYGRLTLGRQFTPFEDLAIHLDPSGIGGADIAIAPDVLLGSNFFTLDSWFNNTVKYTTTLAGFKLSGSYSLGGVAGNERAGTTYSAAASYSTGRLLAGVAYQRMYNADASQFAQNYDAGASLQLGPVRTYLSYMGLRVSGTALAPAQRRDDVPQGGVVWQITPQITLTAAYYDDIANNLGNQSGASGHKQTAYLIGEYFISRRTELYFEVDRNHFSGAYTDDPLNLLVLNMSPGTSGLTGMSIGLATRF